MHIRLIGGAYKISLVRKLWYMLCGRGLQTYYEVPAKALYIAKERRNTRGRTNVYSAS